MAVGTMTEDFHADSKAGCSEDRHASLIAWFTANGIDVSIVRIGPVHVDPDAMTATFSAFQVDIKGRKIIGPEGYLTETVTKPIVVLPSQYGLPKAA